MSLALLLILICFICAYIGYDAGNKRAKEAEKRAKNAVEQMLKNQDKMAEMQLKYENERRLRKIDVNDYNNLLIRYKELMKQHQIFLQGHNKSQADVQSPLVKEMLRFAMTQAHPDAGKEQTPDRFIKYREEYERLYQRRR